MVDFLLQATVSNLIVSTLLALLAWAIQRRVRSASLTNLLWALVLIKLVTPPIVSLPLLELPTVATESEVHPTLEAGLTTMSMAIEEPIASRNLSTETQNGAVDESQLFQWFLFAWAISSVLLLVVSTWRIACFHRVLTRNSAPDRERTHLAQQESRILGLAWSPSVHVTSAHIAPFVWWIGGRAVILLPKESVDSVDERDLRFVLAHELAHIKRKDHWFRWLEWSAIVAFWWNPIMWWSRRQLRIAEELACDDLVLRAKGNATQYASSLLNMAELLASRAIRPPVLASAVNSGGNLEQRLEMILSNKSWRLSPWMRLSLATAALCVFPFGVVYGQDTQSLERRLGGAVEAGELTLDEAQLLLETLRKSREESEVHDARVEQAKNLWMDRAQLKWRMDPDSDRKVRVWHYLNPEDERDAKEEEDETSDGESTKDDSDATSENQDETTPQNAFSFWVQPKLSPDRYIRLRDLEKHFQSAVEKGKLTESRAKAQERALQWLLLQQADEEDDAPKNKRDAGDDETTEAPSFFYFFQDPNKPDKKSTKRYRYFSPEGSDEEGEKETGGDAPRSKGDTPDEDDQAGENAFDTFSFYYDVLR